MVNMCKNPAMMQLVSNLPALPMHIRKSGKSKKWYVNTITGKYIHKDALIDKYRL